ncbi:unnamed protein product [Cylicocyclus nassatus]|uniref:Uncharacterized protein n=1 Tax=Cylicocyclus nassatus TaxID=53992 RepID=A0AA36GN01_CYLNA|nr:unnamed protein product [Cylicocyclus nassatus]
MQGGMYFGLLPFIVLSLIITCPSYAAADCYENWSRCTPQTSAFTGVLWRSCADYCRQCKDRALGRCVPVDNKECSGGYQCRCQGERRIVKSKNLLVQLTCGLGL